MCHQIRCVILSSVKSIVKLELWDLECSISRCVSVSHLLFCFSLENRITRYSNNDWTSEKFFWKEATFILAMYRAILKYFSSVFVVIHGTHRQLSNPVHLVWRLKIYAQIMGKKGKIHILCSFLQIVKFHKCSACIYHVTICSHVKKTISDIQVWGGKYCYLTVPLTTNIHWKPYTFTSF